MRALFIVMLAGCDYSEARFADEVADASCAFAVSCYGESPPTGVGFYGSCTEDSSEPAEDLDCAYNDGRARACVNGILAMECPETDVSPAWPADCALVYDCS